MAVAGPPAAGAATSASWSFASAPTLSPPRVNVVTRNRGTDRGLIFLGIFKNFARRGVSLVGKPGPLILDDRGDPVWSHPIPATQQAANVQVQAYRGKRVLTFWQGSLSLPPRTDVPPGSPLPGSADYIFDSHYRQVARVVAQNGFVPSLHEFLLTSRGTALITAYKTVTTDLSRFGGSATGQIEDTAIQEIDIRTGRLVFQWDMLGQVDPSESYTGLPPAGVWDPYHLNSIAEDSDGNLLASARDTWTIYKINHSTGATMWRLNGKRSDFAVSDDAHFFYQHDARPGPGGELSLFDDGCCELGSTKPPPEPQARGLVLKLDTTQHTATVARQYVHSPPLTVPTQGNFQTLPNGNAFVGWGQLPYFTEFSRAGQALLDVRLPDPDESYRAFRYPWVGKPSRSPSVAVRRRGSTTTVYGSWNGATQVAGWQVLAGSSSRKLRVVVRRARRAGFETSIHTKASGPYFQVRALDARQHVIGSSRVLRLSPSRARRPSPSGGPPVTGSYPVVGY